MGRRPHGLLLVGSLTLRHPEGFFGFHSCGYRLVVSETYRVDRRGSHLLREKSSCGLYTGRISSSNSYGNALKEPRDLSLVSCDTCK